MEDNDFMMSLRFDAKEVPTETVVELYNNYMSAFWLGWKATNIDNVITIVNTKNEIVATLETTEEQAVWDVLYWFWNNKNLIKKEE